jgi:hypothetical protein
VFRGPSGFPGDIRLETGEGQIGRWHGYGIRRRSGGLSRFALGPRIIGVVGIPGACEQAFLFRDGDALNVDAVVERRFDPGLAPVAAPDEAMLPSQLAEEGKVPLPGGLSTDVLDEIASQAVVMYADLLELGGPLFKQLLLAVSSIGRSRTP